MKYIIFMFVLLIGANTIVSDALSLTDFEQVNRQAVVLCEKCISYKWNENKDYSDFEMAQITNEENECLRKVLLDLIERNYSLKKQKNAKKMLLKNWRILEKSYIEFYNNIATQSQRCIDNENDVFSCGTSSMLIAPSIWQTQLKEMITFLYRYSHGY